LKLKYLSEFYIAVRCVDCWDGDGAKGKIARRVTKYLLSVDSIALSWLSASY